MEGTRSIDPDDSHDDESVMPYNANVLARAFDKDIDNNILNELDDITEVSEAASNVADIEDEMLKEKAM